MLNRVVQSVQESPVAFSKYITANDVGATDAHQAGFHIHKEAWPLFFDTPGGDQRNYSSVCLVVPKLYITNFPEEYRSRILTLNDFVGQVMAKQNM